MYASRDYGCWLLALVLLELSGRLTAECDQPNFYRDNVTKKCHPCEDICNPGRGTPEECQRECPDMHIGPVPEEVGKKDDSRPNNTIKWIAIGVAALAAVIVIISLVSIAVVKRVRTWKRRRTNKSSVTLETDGNSQARLALSGGDYSLPREYNGTNEVVPTSPEDERGATLQRQQSRSESDVLLAQASDRERDWDSEGNRASTLDRNRGRKHQLAPTPVHPGWRLPHGQGGRYDSQGYQSSNPLHLPEHDPSLPASQDFQRDLEADSGHDTPVKSAYNSTPAFTMSELENRLQTDLSDVDDIELGLMMNDNGNNRC